MGEGSMHRFVSDRRFILCGVLAATVVLAPSLCTTTARAADLFYSATLDLPVGDDARFFLNLTNRHYAPPQPVAVDIVTRCARPADDFPVVMLLAEASGRDPGTILAMRLEGRSWSAIFVKLNVSHDVLFTGLDHDPGPPYGRAWGHWKNHRGSKKKFALDDAHVIALAKLQTVSAYYRVSPYRVTTEVRNGKSVERYAVAHGRPGAAAAAHNKKDHPAKGKPHKKQGQGPSHGQGGGPNNSP
jgi:hypothetical protein